ncbi:GNAT family N-acetyltransferase [Halomonas sp. M5N1S17]|uniref:GNAT family N-acetyltransferase n=1 Tax=Halomonas alkalisoli TaxID=2907158 RepID=UPI001F26022F|nr:GNAT family N-acetyltransferase [Halomonas alkalisoli]MCE9662596.1 GNAT family N-acetyltransferase [Halomonas alkalisoli]
MSNKLSKRLQTYELTVNDIHETDIEKLHELSIGVGWSHRPEDWQLLMQVGRGYVGCDEIGRVLGSAMWFPMGDDFATIGMVITSPRLQALGAGRWLMNHVLQQCGDRDLRLNATREAYRLYISQSFEPIAVVCQHQGEAVDPGHVQVPGGAQIREAEAADLAEMVRLDREAYGADRTAILEHLIRLSEGTVLMRDGRVAGFALCRPFGRGRVVGPIVTRDVDEAIALTAPHLAHHAGAFVRVDTDCSNSAFTAFLSRCGMPQYDTVTTMCLGMRRGEGGQMRTFALSGHTLG